MASPLKIERVKKDLSQTKLAELTHSHQKRISRLERGARPYPQEARELAELVGVPVEELFPDGCAE